MFKKGNNIFSLLIIILSVLMTSSSYIVKADNTDTGTASTAPKDWGDSLITKGQLQDLNGKPLTEFNQNQSMRAYWEFSNQKTVLIKKFMMAIQWSSKFQNNWH
jgi:hypothetical protein